MKKMRTITSLTLLVMGLSVGIGYGQDYLEYDPARTEAHTEWASQSPYVTPTPSCDSGLALDPYGTLADFVVGVSAGHASDPYVPQHNLYAYKITDPCATGPKKIVVFQTGNHNNEAPGSWPFQGLADFLLSSDPRAGWLRRHCEFYVYPLVNPDGRYTNSGRGNPEMLDEGFGTDHNRVWDTQGQGLSTIDALTVAMQNDTGQQVDYYFDFHSAPGGSVSFFYTSHELMDCLYSQAMIDLDVGVAPVESAGHPGMGRIWGMTAEGLNSQFAFTPETGHNHPDISLQYCIDLGLYYGIALYNTLINEQDINVYTVDMTQEHTEIVIQNPYVTPTPSCDSGLALDPCSVLADFVVGVSAGHVSDPCVPQHNLYAYKITDPCATGPKKKVLIQTGNHNTEETGSWSFQGMIDYILSCEPEAVWMRQHCEFYIYPLVNPDGRYTATGRGNPEMTDEEFGSDHNRVWDRQGEGLSTIDAFTTAMRFDTGQQVDYYFDHHDGGSIASPFYNTMPDLMDCPYSQAMIELDVEIVPNASTGHHGMGRIWSMTEEGLNCEFAFTPEAAPIHPDVNVVMALGWGHSYAIALHNSLMCNIVDMEELEVLASHWLENNLTESHTDPPVGWWAFDEDAGSTAADNIGSNNGTLNNMTDDDWVNGNLGNSLDFDGINDHVVIGDFDYTNANSDFSMCIWFKIDDVEYGGYDGRYKYIFSHGQFNTNNSLNVYIGGPESPSNPEKIRTAFRLSNGIGLTETADTDPLADGLWHMYAITYSSDDGVKIYIDGNPAGSYSDIKGSSFDPTTYIFVGGRCDLNVDRFYGNPTENDGLLDDLRIYDYALSPDVVAAIYNDSPIGWWKFDETSGDTAADSAGDNNGTLVGDPCRVTGLYNGALEFDGNDDYVNLGTSSVFNLTEAFTITAWVNVDTLTPPDGAGRLFNFPIVNKYGSYDDNSNRGYYFNVFPDGKLKARVVQGTNGTSVFTDGPVIEVGNWYHVAATYKYVTNGTSEVRLYVNGELEGGSDIAVGPINDIPNEPVKIGNYEFGGSVSYYFDGLMDDVRIYNQTMSPAEINMIYGGSQVGCSEIPAGDYNEDCKVDLLDFAILSSDWLECVNE